jgi:serpin B
MQRRGGYSYAHVEGVQIVEFPYRGDLSMIVALRDTAGDLASVEHDLERVYPAWITALGSEPVDVDVAPPRWSAQWTGELAGALEQAGMGIAFRAGADFSGMTGGDVRIQSVRQSTFVQVDEGGTEAAAGTAVVFVGVAASVRIDPPKGVFHADHPFLYFVREPVTGALLFAGRLVDPR